MATPQGLQQPVSTTVEEVTLDVLADPQSPTATVIGCHSERDDRFDFVAVDAEPLARPPNDPTEPRSLQTAGDGEPAASFDVQQTASDTFVVVDSEPSLQPPTLPPDAECEQPARADPNSTQSDNRSVTVADTESSANPSRTQHVPTFLPHADGDEYAMARCDSDQTDNVVVAVAGESYEEFDHQTDTVVVAVASDGEESDHQTDTVVVAVANENGEESTAVNTSGQLADNAPDADTLGESARPDNHTSTAADSVPTAQLTHIETTAKDIEVTLDVARNAAGEGLAMVHQHSQKTQQSQKTRHSQTTQDSSMKPTGSNGSRFMPSLSARSRTNSLSSRSSEGLGHRVRTKAEDVEDEVKAIASFEGCEELLRGSDLSVILRNQASIFSDSSGSAATYALSKSTTYIDAFISHNWCVSRWKKWICLLMHFNMRSALLLTFVLASPVGVVAAHGWVPTVHPDFAPYPRSWIFRIILFPMFLFILCFYRDVVRYLPVRDTILFLDKTCIHQEDRKIQRQGIEKLGAFLCHSKTMVICYTDIYLLKLWTVYEVASFMTLQSVEQMRVVPVMFPVVCIGCLTCVWTAGVVALWPEIEFGIYYTGQIFLFCMCYGIIMFNRKWSRGKIAIHRKMATFNVRNCKCFCESDRPLVHANIAALMKATQRIDKDASEDDALDCFDKLVQDELMVALITSIGKYGMRYEHAVGVGCWSVAVVMDQLVGFAHGMSLREFFTYALWYAVIMCFASPFGLMSFGAWADKCLRFARWQEHIYLSLGLIVVFLPLAGTMQALDVLEKWANESDVGMVSFVLLFVISSASVRNVMNGSVTAGSLSTAAAESRGLSAA